MIFGWEQKEENKNITKHSRSKSKSNILTLLTLVSADAKLPMLFRIRPLTKWFMDKLLCLCDVWKGQSYVNVNLSISSIFSNSQFYLKYYCLRYRNDTRRDSAKCQLLRLHSQFSFTKILNVVEFLIFNLQRSEGTSQGPSKNNPY